MGDKSKDDVAQRSHFSPEFVRQLRRKIVDGHASNAPSSPDVHVKVSREELNRLYAQVRQRDSNVSS